MWLLAHQPHQDADHHLHSGNINCQHGAATKLNADQPKMHTKKPAGDISCEHWTCIGAVQVNLGQSRPSPAEQTAEDGYRKETRLVCTGVVTGGRCRTQGKAAGVPGSRPSARARAVCRCRAQSPMPAPHCTPPRSWHPHALQPPLHQTSPKIDLNMLCAIPYSSMLLRSCGNVPFVFHCELIDSFATIPCRVNCWQYSAARQICMALCDCAISRIYLGSGEFHSPMTFEKLQYSIFFLHRREKGSHPGESSRGRHRCPGKLPARAARHRGTAAGQLPRGHSVQA